MSNSREIEVPTGSYAATREKCSAENDGSVFWITIVIDSKKVGTEESKLKTEFSGDAQLSE